MAEGMYPATTRELAAHRAELAPEINEAFENFSRAVFAEGALPEKTKQLIAVAVAHVTQCPYCITGHTKLARRKGARPEEIMEAIWVAAEMRAGGAYAHSTLALHALGDGAGEPSGAPAGAQHPGTGGGGDDQGARRERRPAVPAASRRRPGGGPGLARVHGRCGRPHRSSPGPPAHPGGAPGPGLRPLELVRGGQRSSPARWSASRSTAAVPGRARPARCGGRARRAAR